MLLLQVLPEGAPGGEDDVRGPAEQAGVHPVGGGAVTGERGRVRRGVATEGARRRTITVCSKGRVMHTMMLNYTCRLGAKAG